MTQQSPSVVTLDTLRDKQACSDGLVAFERAYPNGVDVTRWTSLDQMTVLCHVELRRYWGWAVAQKLIPAWSMRGADLTGANLYGADLTGADLDGADLTGANLTGASLDGAFRCASDAPIPGWERNTNTGRLTRVA